MTKNEKRIRDVKIAELALLGLSQQEIADRLSVNKSTISRELQRLREEWKEKTDLDVSELIAKQAAEIAFIKDKALYGWNKSIAQRTKTSTKKKGTAFQSPNSGSDGSVKVIPKDVETSKVTEEADGDPRFLMVYMKGLEREANLFGLDKPKNVPLSGDITVTVVRERKPTHTTDGD